MNASKTEAASRPLAIASHDHRICIRDALVAAEETCRDRGLKLTPLRRRVLELVWQSHRPVGAYDLLERLSEDGKRAMPPTVYRALDFLVDAGLVHRLSTLNAFVGCCDPHHAHQGQFLICSRCRAVVELDSRAVARTLHRQAGELGFQLERQSVELTGVCPGCLPG
jgi:Fur family transcriptional regulator, zinc uptake regulator